jgi:hypothetical protein
VMQRTWEAEHINWRNPPKKRSKPAPLQNLEIVEAGNLVG